MSTFVRYALLVAACATGGVGILHLMYNWGDERLLLLLVGVPYQAYRILPVIVLGFIHPVLGLFEIFALYFANLLIPAFLYMETGSLRWAWLQAALIVAHFLGGFGLIWRMHGI